MADEGPDAASFEAEASELLDEIARSRKRIDGIAGLLDGTLDRFRERIDRLIRESEVDNRRQVRIFIRDVDAVAGDLAKAAKEGRIATRLVAALDASLRKMRKRDFWGARKAWRRLDRIAEQAAEVRRLQLRYRDAHRAVEARIRTLRAEADRLERVPRPPASPEDAAAFNAQVDAFNAAATTAYLDFLSTARADLALPLLLETSVGGGIGLPAPPRGCDPEPLLALLASEGPSPQDAMRTRSFYGLLELPEYSDAKLTHLLGDARVVRSALDAAWPWLKAIREDERRSLLISWSDDATVLRRRVPAIVGFLERLSARGDAVARGRALAEALNDGRFESWQRAARMYTTFGTDAERKWRGELEPAIEAMRAEAAELAAVLKRFPEPAKLEAEMS